MHESSEVFEIRPDLTAELHALERLKNGIATFSQLFLIKSFSYLQVMMTYIRAWMSLKFGQIRSGTTELAALEHLKIDVALFLVSQFWLHLGNSQVGVYRTIGPLVVKCYVNKN